MHGLMANELCVNSVRKGLVSGFSTSRDVVVAKKKTVQCNASGNASATQPCRTDGLTTTACHAGHRTGWLATCRLMRQRRARPGRVGSCIGRSLTNHSIVVARHGAWFYETCVRALEAALRAGCPRLAFFPR
jgi:hypothetical protein